MAKSGSESKVTAIKLKNPNIKEAKTKFIKNGINTGTKAQIRVVSGGKSTVINNPQAVVVKAPLSSKGTKLAAPIAIDIIAKKAVTTYSIKFNVGDKVVYPTHGIGQVNAIMKKTIGGADVEFYDILIIESGMKLLVPVDQVESQKLRPVVDKKTLQRVYDILKERSGKIDTQTWNRRYREYTQKIQTGSVYEMAEVFRDLSVLSVDKELSFGERRMLEKVEELLVSEIAVAKAKSIDRIKGELAELVLN